MMGDGYRQTADTTEQMLGSQVLFLGFWDRLDSLRALTLMRWVSEEVEAAKVLVLTSLLHSQEDFSIH